MWATCLHEHVAECVESRAKLPWGQNRICSYICWPLEIRRGNSSTHVPPRLCRSLAAVHSPQYMSVDCSNKFILLLPPLSPLGPSDPKQCYNQVPDRMPASMPNEWFKQVASKISEVRKIDWSHEECIFKKNARIHLKIGMLDKQRERKRLIECLILCVCVCVK